MARPALRTRSPEEQAARRARIRASWLLSAPALILLTFAAFGPLLIVLAYSFVAPGEYSGVVWKVTGEGWFEVLFSRDIFDDTVSLAEAHLSIFWRSVSLSLLTTLITLIFGFPTAYFIATRPEKQRPLWLFLITIPFWTNLLIRTFAIMEVIRNEGIVNTVLLNLGIIDQPLQMLYTYGSVLMGMAYVYLPLMVLPIYASMERFDFRLVEAGYDLYASRFDILRLIVLPIVKPGIVAGSILVFVPSLGAYVTPRVLGGGNNMMLGNLIELQFGQGRNWPLGAALSITLLIIVAGALVFYVRAANREDPHG
ncbi:ABC transporter permease [Paroceanicella profunda]|uniref:ABC transporter permease n=1 Tax=Paroceanicella profunda TaxID=2579971 RepID=A0A5B8FFW0_9RHOB|nr:ABC transporter permease [Paroceanicella profunda]QDL90451.1 ABC transporter permease [Paroceanicella profunda]